MAKLIDRGSAGPDHPIYSGGLEIFSRQGSKPSAPTPLTSAKNTTAKSAVGNKYQFDGINPDIRYSIRTSEGVNQPDVIIGSTLGTASKHPDYAAAKGRDL
jgi:hypothetical protein